MGCSSRTTPTMSSTRQSSLADVVGSDDRFVYECDFGDSWNHEVVVENVTRVDPALKLPVCIYGAKACPPEDCGGTGRFDELLKVLADPTHEQYKHLPELGDFDPTGFDLAQVNAVLQRLARTTRASRTGWSAPDSSASRAQLVASSFH